MTNRIDWTKPVQTRGGSKVDIYYIREGYYVNGAYYSEDSDTFFPVQWDFNGYYANKKSALDLVNVGKETKIKA